MSNRQERRQRRRQGRPLTFDPRPLDVDVYDVTLTCGRCGWSDTWPFPRDARLLACPCCGERGVAQCPTCGADIAIPLPDEARG